MKGLVVMEEQYQDYGAEARAGARDAGAGTRDAHVHEDGTWTSPLGIDPEFVLKFFEEWRAAEEQIASYNNVKKAMLAKTRSLFGPYHTEALKRACVLALKEPEAVARNAVLDKQAAKYLETIRRPAGQ